MLKLLAILSLLALTGCAQLDAGQAAVAERGAAVNDEALQSAEFVMCRGISIGAWVRRYGSTPILAEAWRVLCGQQITNLPTP